MIPVADAEFTVAFAEWWAGQWRGPTRFVLRDRLLWPIAPGEGPTSPDLVAPGTLFSSLTDHHVHLGLINIDELWRGGLTSVLDLGWRPEDAARWRASNTSPTVKLTAGLSVSHQTSVQMPQEIGVVGGLLSCRDGYPAHSGWAPPGATIELDSPEDAAAAVRQQVELGASAIKVTLNSDAGPVPDDALLAAIVREAASGGEWHLGVIAHAQGAGQAERAFNAGVSTLAHAPFSERLSDELLVAMASGGGGHHPTAMSWISTLDIHGWGEPTAEFAIAQDNIRRFRAAGGQVLYGTDLGNGPLAQGVNERELLALVSAGFDREALLTSISPRLVSSTAHGPVGPRIAWAPGLPPADAAATASWIATAQSAIVTQLKETAA